MAATVTLVAGSAFGGPIQGGPRAIPAGVTDLVPLSSGAWVSFGAYASPDTSTTPNPLARVSRSGAEVSIPWSSQPEDSYRVPIADPDWRLQPRSRGEGQSRQRGAVRRAEVSLSALRSDERSVPALGGPESGDESAPASEHLDEAGNPVFAAPTKYFQDFEDGTVAREWTLAGIDELEKFGRFAGPFRNSAQTLFVKCEPDTPYIVSFDLLFIAANLGDVSISDLFSVEVDGEALLRDTFQVLIARNEEFNGEREDFDRDIYKQVAVTFTPRGDGVVKIVFKSTPHGNRGGETWGLDNVHIDIAPKQTLGELTHDEGSVIAASGFLGQTGLATAGGPFDSGQNYFRGDPSLRGNGPNGPRLPPPTPVPAPGAGLVLLAGGVWASRRVRA